MVRSICSYLVSVFFLAALLLEPTALHAQAFGIGANAGYYTVNGADFEGTEGGFGWEGMVALVPGGRSGTGMPGGMGGGMGGLATGGFALAGGIMESEHEIQGSEDELQFRQFFLSPGLNMAPPESRVRLSVRTRVGLAQLALRQSGDEKLDGNGFMGGGSVGAEIFLVKFLAVEPSVFAGYMNFAEPTDAQDQPPQPGVPFPIPGITPGERLSGWTLGFRLGANILVR